MVRDGYLKLQAMTRDASWEDYQVLTQGKPYQIVIQKAEAYKVMVYRAIERGPNIPDRIGAVYVELMDAFEEASEWISDKL